MPVTNNKVKTLKPVPKSGSPTKSSILNPRPRGSDFWTPTRLRELSRYIEKFGTFMCGDEVLPDGSNAYISRHTLRDGSVGWRIRCLKCWRKSAADSMRKSRERARKRKSKSRG